MLLREFRSFIGSQFQRLWLKIHRVETKLMTTFSELMTAIQNQGLAIAAAADSIASEGVDLKALLENLQANVSPTEEELASALSQITDQTDKLIAIKDAALALVPTVETPTEPTEPGEPLPVPSESVPTDPSEIVITPVDDSVGLPDGVSLSITE